MNNEQPQGYMAEYKHWLGQKEFAAELKAELDAIKDAPREIEDRFYKELEFGTAGLRGILGAGTNRMNIPVVRRATRGLADHILNIDGAAWRGVAIAYDSRHKSAEFAMQAALTLCSRGIKAYLYDSLRPVPMLSHAVRRLGCIAGIVITASHNPPQYNGYKVYWQHGGQADPELARQIYEHIRANDYFTPIDIDAAQAAQRGLLVFLNEADDADYYRDTLSVLQRGGFMREHGADISIVYTPLHGSGNKPVQKILALSGAANVHIVAAQQQPDGDFPTVSAPNPEDPKAFYLADKLAHELGADIIIATDPDSDRMGIAVRDNAGEYRVLSGNKIGSLLLYYILSSMRERGALPKDAFAVKSIVSTRLADDICAHFGIKLISVPTGFRFISELIEQSRSSGQGSFVFGFEESYGFLAGGFARDKDAVCAAMLAAEACAYYKSLGKTLLDALEDIYSICGCHAESAKSYTLSGKAGIERIAAAMQGLRAAVPREFAGIAVEKFEDMRSGAALCFQNGEALPCPSDTRGMDAVRFLLAGGAWICVRPSGTEPKLKLYIGTKAENVNQANALLNKLTAAADAKLNALLNDKE